MYPLILKGVKTNDLYNLIQSYSEKLGYDAAKYVESWREKQIMGELQKIRGREIQRKRKRETKKRERTKEIKGKMVLNKELEKKQILRDIQRDKENQREIETARDKDRGREREKEILLQMMKER